jgi:two-component system LytT family sensor kinase
MLNLNRTHLYWIFQISGWGIYGGLISLASFNTKGFNLNASFLTNLIFSVFLGIALSHYLRKQVIYSGLIRIKRITDILKVMIILLAISFLHVFSTKILSILVSWSFVNISLISFLINWASILLLFGFWLTLYYGFQLFEQNQRQELDNLALKAFQSELELQNLRSQLNPHFLFNALNAIRALIEVDPKKSKEAVTLLSNLLRFSLSTSYDRLISLENELQMVDSYLSLEKIRFEERLNIKKEINDDLKSLKIPAFIIQTLVENGIKHGVSKLIEGGEIFIRIEKEDDFILIQVANSGTIGSYKDLGIGLSNLRKRLDIEYKTNYNFSIYQSEMVYVDIRIPTNR